MGISLHEAVLHRFPSAVGVIGADGVMWCTPSFAAGLAAAQEQPVNRGASPDLCAEAATLRAGHAIGPVGGCSLVSHGPISWDGGTGVLVELVPGGPGAGQGGRNEDGDLGKPSYRPDLRSAAIAVARESAGFLEEVFDTVGEGVMAYDHTGKVLLANRAAKEFLAEGRAGWDAYDTEGRKRSLQDPSHVGIGDETYASQPIELRRRDGTETRWVMTRTRAATLPGGACGMVTSFADITEHMLALAAAEESRQTYRAVFSQAGAGILTVIIRGDESTVEMNEAAAEMLGMSEIPKDLEETIALRPVIYDLDGIEVPIERGPMTRVLHGERLRREVFHLRHGSEIRWIEVSGACAVLGERRSVSALWLADVTAERAREAVLVAAGTQLAQANEDLRQMFRHLSEAGVRERADVARELHDGPVQTLVALRWAVGSHDPELAATCELVIDQLRSMILDLRPPVLDLEGLAAACADLLSRSPIAGRLETGDLDESALAGGCRELGWRVVREGAQNVARHAPGASEVVVMLRSADNHLFIEVRDDGPGADPESVRDAAREGHYGLHLLRQGVEAAGGSLALRAGEHGGAVLHAEIPCR